MLLSLNLKEGGDMHLFSARRSFDFTLYDEKDGTVAYVPHKVQCK
jgi:hypothetical protein